MKVNITEVISCGKQLYYKINPKSTMDIPSFFFEKLEGDWLRWKNTGSELTFCEYCEKKYIK